jgi:hypothetical protein
MAWRAARHATAACCPDRLAFMPSLDVRWSLREGTADVGTDGAVSGALALALLQLLAGGTLPDGWAAAVAAGPDTRLIAVPGARPRALAAFRDLDAVGRPRVACVLVHPRDESEARQAAVEAGRGEVRPVASLADALGLDRQGRPRDFSLR